MSLHTDPAASHPRECGGLSLEREFGIEADGFSIVPGVCDAAECAALAAELGVAETAGRRGLLESQVIAAFANSEQVLGLVRPHLPAEPFPVRAIYFDKSPETNWAVPWHQDLTIAVRERVDVAGFGPWSVKEGVPHVQPPVELLERVLTIRLHLDAADESNGALKVLPGSHRLGRLASGRIQGLREEVEERLCSVAAGGVLLMRPLILHASGRSTSPRHRRVLHIEYADAVLPGGLQWHERAGRFD